VTLAVGDRVRIEKFGDRKTSWVGVEGTVVGPYSGAFNYAVEVAWDVPGPPKSHVIEGYLVKIDDTLDEVEGFFV